MSAIARFLVEFEPSLPSISPQWPALSALPAPSGAMDEIETDDDALDLSPQGPSDEIGFEDRDDFEAEPTDDKDTTLAVAEAVAAALAAAEEAFAERIAALEVQHADARAEDRLRWTEDQGAVLAEGLRRACADIEGHLADAAAAVLEPLVADAVRGLALSEFRQAIASLTVGGASARIAVTGPADLVHALQCALEAAGTDTSGMTFEVSEAIEVTMTADNSTVQTRLADWAGSFERTLGGNA